MSSRIVRYLLERVTSIDLGLMTRFARRERDRLLSALRQSRHMHGPVGNTVGLNREQSLNYSSLAGLEVEYASGSSVQVTAGSILLFNPSPAVETRPLTWSGRIETDDYGVGLFVLPSNRTVAPSVPISSALASPEWWTIYVRPSEVAVESDSQRRVFNETTGVFDVASVTKVAQYQATPGVVRGAPGGGIPNVTGAYDIPIAWIYVPSGASDLSGATIYDVRKLHDELGLPNMVGGQWECTVSGAMPDAYGGVVWVGNVWARIGGERLFAASSSGLSITQLIEPGASWDNTSSLSAPKIAWLYLCKPKSVVPRPRRQGSAVIGSSGRNDRTILEGALVLSPKPPNVGVRATNNPDAALRWDMRPSSSLALPNSLSGSVPYAFGGVLVQPDDAICVGLMLYAGVDSLGHPQVYGPQYVSDEGWSFWNVFAGPLGAALPLGAVTASYSLGAASVGLTQASVNVGGTPYLLPLTGFRAYATFFNDAAGKTVFWIDANGADEVPMITNGTSYIASKVVERRTPAPGAQMVSIALGTPSAGVTSFGVAASLMSVRFPYREALVT